MSQSSDEAGDTIDDPSSTLLKDMVGLWFGGKRPETTLRKYLIMVCGLDDDEAGDWGRVCRLGGVRRVALDMTREEMADAPKDEVRLPEEYRSEYEEAPGRGFH